MTDTDEPPERRIRLTLHYDGAGFAGWQAQPRERTAQGELEGALQRLMQRRTPVTAAGRTDRGVHATGQVASTLVPCRWTAPELQRALNAVLPADLWVAAAVETETRFHARYDALARGYVYRVGTDAAARSPFLSRWCWPVREPLDPDALSESARRFVGDRSFLAFAKTGQPERGERCAVRSARWRPWGRTGQAFEIVANRFLHHMVRYMVGTMVDVARGRRPADDIDALLAGGSGLETSAPAPPEGLFLARVFYESDELEAEEPLHEILP